MRNYTTIYWARKNEPLEEIIVTVTNQVMDLDTVGVVLLNANTGVILPTVSASFLQDLVTCRLAFPL